MDNNLAALFWQQLWHALQGETPPPPVILQGYEAFASAYPVSELAATSMALAAQSAAGLVNNPAKVTIDIRRASRWFQHTFRPINRPLPASWDAFAGDYATVDGWIRLHTNAPLHRQAMERVLGKQPDRAALAKIVAGWQKQALEQAVIDAGGCAAEMRSLAEWQQHPQGKSVAQEALIAWEPQAEGAPPAWQRPIARPLRGVKVLDLTRIIAGPVATRFLAGLGAEVLRLDPPGWEEPSLEEEMMQGKRCARLDLKSVQGRQQFEQLLAQADVLVHGYRADALENLGYDSARRQQLAPGLVDVSLNAWGWSGPWRNRRGFDSLVQMACGIADAGQRWQAADAPCPLPVQALDHATGYLMAAAVLEGMRRRVAHRTGITARLSLARTAHLLTSHPYPAATAATGPGPAQPHDESDTLEITPLGIGYRLRPPLWLPGTPLLWSRSGSPLGSASASWLPA
ncbi:acyl-CoA transferase [Mixta theicola]|uniref:Acyl-CoA transferase n=1 Tax=Mixta theicola TaxID=1458355 RepID=A0A2K1QE40_9GAMM|nr:CoA transferase [Mixta theicola]PNS13276.1 acyl-CoA transferase [Mixta theicola]GLR08998.1 coa transferase caib/baif family protein [Mixta theicola]